MKERAREKENVNYFIVVWRTPVYVQSLKSTFLGSTRPTPLIVRIKPHTLD